MGAEQFFPELVEQARRAHGAIAERMTAEQLAHNTALAAHMSLDDIAQLDADPNDWMDMMKPIALPHGDRVETTSRVNWREAMLLRIRDTIGMWMRMRITYHE